MTRPIRYLCAMLAGIGVTFSAGAIAGLTANDIFNAAEPAARERLLAGEIVVVTRPEQETDDAGLALSLGVIVPADLAKTLATLRSLNVNDDPKQRRTTREITGQVKDDGSSKTFAEVGFAADESGEVDKLLSAGPGDQFNHSAEEWGWAREAAAAGGDRAEAAARMMRRVLESRYLAYRRAGLEGQPPFARAAGKLTSPGAELAASTEAMPVIRQHTPDFYQAYRNYPKGSAAGIQHRFFWEKKTADGRPMFSLRHEMVQLRPELALIANREYYISNNVNSYQVVIMLVPYGNQTLAVLVNQTYTQNVAGTKRFVAVRIGRSIVESNTKPLFEKLQKVLGRAKPTVAGAAAP